MNTEEMHEAKKSAAAFLLRYSVGVLATTAEQYQVHASTIYYIADKDLNIYFLTSTESRKFAALRAHPQVAFVVSTPEVPQTLQIEGMAMDMTLEQGAQEKKEELMQLLEKNKQFYPPLSKLNPTSVAVVWVRPTWVRWADYAFEEVGAQHVLKEFTIEQ